MIVENAEHLILLMDLAYGEDFEGGTVSEDGRTLYLTLHLTGVICTSIPVLVEGFPFASASSLMKSIAARYDHAWKAYHELQAAWGVPPSPGRRHDTRHPVNAALVRRAETYAGRRKN